VLRGGREPSRLTPGDRLEDDDLPPGFSLAVDDIFAETDH